MAQFALVRHGLAVVLLIIASYAPSFAAGAIAVGKCGAYGQAFDYPNEAAAAAAARKQCEGTCTVVPFRRACAAISIDLREPCGSHGYSTGKTISKALNAAAKQCYDHGGKDCVIRAWACDARG